MAARVFAKASLQVLPRETRPGSTEQMVLMRQRCVAMVLGARARKGPGEKSTIQRSLTPGASNVLVGPGMFWRKRYRRPWASSSFCSSQR